MVSEKSGIDELKWTPGPKGMEMMEGMKMEDNMMMMEPPVDEMMAEGGEMMDAEMAGKDAEMAGKDAAAAFFDESALGQVAGPGELPKLLLEGMVVHPYVGDLVRSQVVAWELSGKGDDQWSHLAALTSAVTEAGEKTDADCFMAAWLGEEDKAEFDDIVASKGTRAIVFPGTVFAYANDEDALKRASDKTQSKQKLEQYLFKVNAKALKLCGDKIHAVHRLFAKVKTAAKPEGKDYTLVELELFEDHAKKTMAEFAEALAAGKAVVDATKDKVEDKMENKEMMMEEKMDDMMMEAPME